MARVRVLFFGTYDAETITRVRVLQEGFAAHGDVVDECNVPLPLSTRSRVRMLERPWLAVGLAATLSAAWFRLVRKARRLPRPDAVVVGYMGHFDVHLARRLWPRQPLVLDHLISGHDTALDRRVRSAAVLRALRRLDRSSLAAADIPCVDTTENLELVPPSLRTRALVVPVGAPERWFHAPQRADKSELTVVFYGSYTPLHGAPTIGQAIGLLAAEGAPIRFSMVGSGQDYDSTRLNAGDRAAATWIDWIEPAELPAFVAEHDVCLGIFGTTPKARRVVPMKVFGGAAAGCAVMTSATAPQQRALGEAAMYVRAGDADALAAALGDLAGERDRVWQLRLASYAHAGEAFRPEVVVAGLRDRVLRAMDR